MKNTRKEILNTARALFNQYGIADITLRSIAIEMEISHGNLNYHFKKREDLLEALYFEMADVFDKRVESIGEMGVDMKQLFIESAISMIRMVDYRFIWIDLSQLLRENSNIRSHFISVRTKRESGYQFVFRKLTGDGIMREEQFPGEYSHLITRLMLYSDFWLSSLDIYQRPVDREITLQHHQVFFEMFYPYLTNKGLDSLDETEWRKQLSADVRIN